MNGSISTVPAKTLAGILDVLAECIFSYEVCKHFESTTHFKDARKSHSPKTARILKKVLISKHPARITSDARDELGVAQDSTKSRRHKKTLKKSERI